MNVQPVGTHLRQWRQRRRLSQLDLAGEADISARHLSFVETGRAQPSREMIAPGLNVFRHAGNIEAHHNVLRFNWHMARKADGHSVAIGFEFFVLADDGRIAADYQFIDRSE